MKKDIHPEITQTIFTCASCNSKFTILSTVKQDEITVDICSHCHPFYIGATSLQTTKGRAEKLSLKFKAGKENIDNSNINKKNKLDKSEKSNFRAKTLSDL